MGGKASDHAVDLEDEGDLGEEGRKVGRCCGCVGAWAGADASDLNVVCPGYQQS
jgi:hypothetical protein